MSDYGFKVSKTGYDVKTASNDQLAMTSALVSDRVITYSVFTHTHTGTQHTTLVDLSSLSLGYPPQCLVYIYGFGYVPWINGGSTGTFTAYDVSVSSAFISYRTTTSAARTFSDTIYIAILYSPIT